MIETLRLAIHKFPHLMKIFKSLICSNCQRKENLLAFLWQILWQDRFISQVIDTWKTNRKLDFQGFWSLQAGWSGFTLNRCGSKKENIILKQILTLILCLLLCFRWLVLWNGLGCILPKDQSLLKLENQELLTHFRFLDLGEGVMKCIFWNQNLWKIWVSHYISKFILP